MSMKFFINTLNICTLLIFISCRNPTHNQIQGGDKNRKMVFWDHAPRKGTNIFNGKVCSL